MRRVRSRYKRGDAGNSDECLSGSFRLEALQAEACVALHDDHDASYCRAVASRRNSW